MAAGVAGGLQNRADAREGGPVGSIPTRSRQRRLAARRVLAALVLGWFLLPVAGLLAQEPGVDTTGAAKGAAALHLGGTPPAADSIRPPVPCWDPANK